MSSPSHANHFRFESYLLLLLASFGAAELLYVLPVDGMKEKLPVSVIIVNTVLAFLGLCGTLTGMLLLRHSLLKRKLTTRRTLLGIELCLLMGVTLFYVAGFILAWKGNLPHLAQPVFWSVRGGLLLVYVIMICYLAPHWKEAKKGT